MQHTSADAWTDWEPDSIADPVTDATVLGGSRHIVLPWRPQALGSKPGGVTHFAPDDTAHRGTHSMGKRRQNHVAPGAPSVLVI